MNIKDIDIKILNVYNDARLKKEKLDIWEITKKIFCNSKDFKELNSHYNLVKTRVKILEGIFLINDGDNFFKLKIKGDCNFNKHKFPDGYKNCVILKSENKWCIFEL